MLEKEYSYFEEHKKEFISNHPNEYVVIAGDEVVGFFSTEEEAIKESLKKYNPGEFLSQQCSQNSDQVMRFHSRVVLS